MKKTLFKTMAMVLACVLVIGSLTACSKSTKTVENSTSDVSTDSTTVTEGANSEEAKESVPADTYNASMIYLTRVDPPAAEVTKLQDAINVLTKKDLNTEVTLIPMTVGNYFSQASLLLGSGEEYDIVPMLADWAATFTQGQYVLDLTNYLDKMPDLVAAVGEDNVKACSTGSYNWGVPTMKEQINPLGFIMNADIVNKLGIDVSTIKSYDDMTAIFAKVHEAYPDMDVYGGYAGITPVLKFNDMDTLGDRFGVLMNYGQSTKVTNYYESDEFMKLAKLMRSWYEAGYVSKDFATSQDYGDALVGAGNLFCYVSPCKPDTQQESSGSSGVQIAVAVVEQGVKSTSTVAGFNYAIAGSCKDPDRAAALMNYIYSSPEINDILTWGIEGQDWAETSDGLADYPQGVTADTVTFHNGLGWAQPNQFLAHIWTGNDPDIWNKYGTFNDSAKVSAALGFCADLSTLADQVSACNAVLSEYGNSIGAGSVDPDTTIKEMNDKLYAAGLQNIIDLKQKQLDEWLANNKK